MLSWPQLPLPPTTPTIVWASMEEDVKRVDPRSRGEPLFFLPSASSPPVSAGNPFRVGRADWHRFRRLALDHWGTVKALRGRNFRRHFYLSLKGYRFMWSLEGGDPIDGACMASPHCVPVPPTTLLPARTNAMTRHVTGYSWTGDYASLFPLSFVGSYLSPFFQRLRVMAASFRATWTLATFFFSPRSRSCS